VTRLDKAANVALIAASLLLVGSLVRNYYLSRMPDPNIKPEIKKGEVIKPLEQALTAESPATVTLVLALSTHCRFCHASVPFYQKLAALKNSSASRVRLAAIMPESKEEAEDYLKKNGIAADAVVSMPMSQIGVNGTPTLLLLDGQNKLIEAWAGQLNSSQESEVIGHLRKLCPGCLI